MEFEEQPKYVNNRRKKLTFMKFKTIESLPGNNGNAYSSSKRLYHAINVTAENTIYSSLTEAVDWELKDDKQGGIIVLSTDVNAVELDENSVINKLKQLMTTFKNRLFSTAKIDKVAQKNNLLEWTVGHFLSGRYTTRRGVTFGENSVSIEVVDVDSTTLVKIATELCSEFLQEEVLVKDYNTGKIYFVNSEE